LKNLHFQEVQVQKIVSLRPHVHLSSEHKSLFVGINTLARRVLCVQ
jgi:hypothetical protein